MSTHQEIVKAISAHGFWKTRLSDAVETGKSEFEARVVATDDHCDFGKWLKSESANFKGNSHHEKCSQLHAAFHKHAAVALSLALEGKKAEATKASGPGSQFALVSSQLVSELMAWDRESS